MDILHFNMTAGTVGMQRNLNLIPGLIALGLANRNSDPSASQSLRGSCGLAVSQRAGELGVGAAGSQMTPRPSALAMSLQA